MCEGGEEANIELVMLDTAGMEKYRSISSTYLRGAQICVVMFALDSVSSFINARRWCSFAREYNEDLEIILVGNKMDQAERNVQPMQVAELAFEIRANKYFECSALTGEGVFKLFDIEWPTTEEKETIAVAENKKCC